MRASTWTIERRRSLRAIAVVLTAVTIPGGSPAASAPPGSVQLQIELLRARAGQGALAAVSRTAAAQKSRLPPPASPPDVRVLSRAELSMRDGEVVDRDLAGGFGVRFQLVDEIGGERLLLRDFQLVRPGLGGAAVLFGADLRPWLDRPLALGLTRSESDPEVLWLLLTCTRRGRLPE